MAARNKTSGHDVAPSLTSHQNSKLNAIHEGSLDHLTNEQGVSRVRKRDLIAGAWQEAASRIPNKSMPIPFRLRQAPAAPQQEESTPPRESRRRHRFRSLVKSKADPPPPETTRQKLGMTRQFSVMPPLSVRELNATLIVPVYQQCFWDIVALLLSFCSSGLEASIAVVLFLVPSNLMRKWWEVFVSSWIVGTVHGCWLWLVHSLHSGRRHARMGSMQQTGTILAAGAALAAYNASMQSSCPPDAPRRSKWRKK